MTAEQLATIADESEEQTPLPEGWRLVRLDDVCECHTGIRNPHKSPDTPFRYVDISSVDNTAKRIVEAKTILGKDAPSRARQIIRTNDVLVATTRPNLNAVALVRESLDNEICSTGFCVLRATDKIDSGYLFAYVQSESFIASLSNLVKGALYPAVTDKQVRAQFIPLPPTIEEQRRIAAVLDEQIKAVEQARRAVEEQIEAAKFLPGAFLRLVFESEEARDWREVQVKDICSKIDYGFTASADFTKKEPKFLRITDIQNGHVNWDKVPSCQITESEAQANALQDGDIVFARTGGTVGKSFLIHNPPSAVFASYLIRLSPTESVLSDYLYLFFQSDSYWRQIRAGAQGGAQPNVNATTLGNLKLLCPSIGEQAKLVKKLNEKMQGVEQLKKSLTEQLEVIEKMPAALLRKAFAGEV
jgi:type I restriction enzyme S subunit